MIYGNIEGIRESLLKPPPRWKGDTATRVERVTSLREVREILPAAKYSRAPVPKVRAKAQKQVLPTSRSLAILAMYDVLFLFLQKRKSTKKKSELKG